MDRIPLFLTQGRTITAEHIAALFVLLARRDLTSEEMEQVRVTLAARRGSPPRCRQADQ